MENTTNPALWISKNFNITHPNGIYAEFSMSGVSIDSIAKVIPPPFYVYDYNTIKDQYNNLAKALTPNGIEILYSVKPNTNLNVIKSLKELGSGMEVASEGELYAVRKVGVDPKNVSFAGPVKTEKEISDAIDFGINIINVESFEEFGRINRIAKEKSIIQKVGLRVNSLKQVKGAGGLMAGGSQKFGFDEESLDSGFFDKVLSFKNIRLEGVHVFAATQMLNIESFLDNITNICNIAAKLNKYFKVKSLDFGGGLGIPYAKDQPELPLKEIKDKIKKILDNFSFIKENKTRLFVEPGRFLVGKSGIYVSQVDNVKISRGEIEVQVDGGIHHMMRPSMMGNHPVYNLTKLNGEEVKATIGGSLCTSIDVIAKDVLLVKPSVGDLIGVFNAGAYGFTQAMTLFLSHPTAAEVMVKDGKFYLIRPSINPKEFFDKQIIV